MAFPCALKYHPVLSICAASVLSLGACADIPSRTGHANEISQKNRLHRHDISTQMFQLASWQKLTAPEGPIHLYIEGDALAWLSRSTPSKNPTPKEAVALELAANDPAPNVVYLARPCQYTDFDLPHNNCHRDYWTGKRFSQEVLESYHSALNQLEKDYKRGFHLIGYSGGANIAGLLAARREDILSLRTVAGNVDNDFFTRFHNVSDMPYSLNMADYAESLSALPQYHFIAENDAFVPPPVFESYAGKAGSSACIRAEIVKGTEHIKGWATRWRDLLKRTPACLPGKN